MEKSSCPGCPGISFSSSPSCAAHSSGLLPGGGGDRWRYVPAVCRAGDDDSNHRRAQGICTRMVLALAGRDAMNFWRRPTAALLARTFILSSPARGRGSARRGQPLPTARSRAEQHPALSQSDCFKVYRKEWCWCGVQRFSKIGPPLGLLRDLYST
jgi:hypothetical protein